MKFKKAGSIYWVTEEAVKNSTTGPEMRSSTRGSAAAQCGEAPPHRNHSILSGERLRLEPSGGGVASKTGQAFPGEAEPHRTVRRQSRGNLMTPSLVSLAAAFLFVTCQLA